jgi:hypothetical protein
VDRALDRFVLTKWNNSRRIPYRGRFQGGGWSDVGYLDALEKVELALSQLSNFAPGGVTETVIGDLCIASAPPLKLGEVVGFFRECHLRAQSLCSEHKELARGPHTARTPFAILVGRLARVFDHAGWKVSAAKTSRAKSPRASDFVRFVLAVMACVDPSIREHSHSEAAMAKALSPILTARRKALSVRDTKLSEPGT